MTRQGQSCKRLANTNPIRHDVEFRLEDDVLHGSVWVDFTLSLFGLDEVENMLCNNLYTMDDSSRYYLGDRRSIRPLRIISIDVPMNPESISLKFEVKLSNDSIAEGEKLYLDIPRLFLIKRSVVKMEDDKQTFVIDASEVPKDHIAVVYAASAIGQRPGRVQLVYVKNGKVQIRTRRSGSGKYGIESMSQDGDKFTFKLFEPIGEKGKFSEHTGVFMANYSCKPRAVALPQTVDEAITVLAKDCLGSVISESLLGPTIDKLIGDNEFYLPWAQRRAIRHRIWREMFRLADNPGRGIEREQVSTSLDLVYGHYYEDQYVEDPD